MTRWLGVVAAGIALVASACDPIPQDIQTSIALVNVTHQNVALQVFRPPAPLACSTVASDLATNQRDSVLGASAFAFEACHDVAPFDVTPLDVNGTTGETRVDAGAGRACDAVLLRSEGLADTIMFWNGIAQAQIVALPDYEVEDAHFAYLNRVGPKLTLEPAAVSTSWVASFTLPAVPCGAQ